MNKILHNQTLWRIVWAYTLILYPYHFISLLATGKQPINTNSPATKKPTLRLAIPVNWITPLFCPNVVLGKVLNMPASNEFVAHEKTEKQISSFIGADRLFYQDLNDLIASVKEDGSEIQKFDASCFDGKYVTEDVTQDYLKELDTVRNDASKQKQTIDISEDVIVY